MKPVHTFNVTPLMPPELERLRDLSYDLRWAWNHDAIGLFRWDNDLWEASRNNPVRMINSLDQAALKSAAEDEGFLSHLDSIAKFMRDALIRATKRGSK